MRFNWSFLVLCFCLLWPVSYTDANSEVKNLQVEVSQVLRADSFRWSIAGETRNGDHLNVLSELKWDDLDVYELQLRASGDLGGIEWLNHDLFFTGCLGGGTIYNGQVRDSDFAASNRRLEWSRSVSGAGDGQVVDFSVEIGPVFVLKDRPVKITPILGFQFDYLGLVLQDGRQVYSDQAIYDQYFQESGGTVSVPPPGPIEGLDSSYEAYLFGPVVGVRLELPLNEAFSLATAFRYHLFYYFAQADWNLRTDLDHPVSFEHSAVGDGFDWSLEAFYRLSERWSVMLLGASRYFTTQSGTDKTYLEDGTVSKTTLNKVTWESHSVSLSFQYLF